MLTIMPNPWIGLLLILEVIAFIVIFNSCLLVANYNETAARAKRQGLQTPSARLQYLWRRRRRLLIGAGSLLSLLLPLITVDGIFGGTIWPAAPVARARR
jgi:hypothetical protein